MKNQKELNLEEMEKVSGGEAVELAGGFKLFISVQKFGADLKSPLEIIA